MTKNRESTDDKQETTHNYDTHTHTPIQIRSSDDWRTAPNTFIIERYRDTFTPVDCGRATNQVHRPKVETETEFSTEVYKVNRQDKTSGVDTHTEAHCHSPE